MIIGDWAIDDAGQITHLTCRFPAGSWAHSHRCWQASGKDPMVGHYIIVYAPEFVILVAKNQYDIWAASKEPWRGKV